MIKAAWIILAFLLLAASTSGATITADSISRIDVAAAITAASNGDTINVPAGDAEWSSAVTIPAGKALKIIGAGKNSSRIINTSGGQNTWCFLVDTELEDAAIRISGIGFFGTNTTGNAQGSGIFVDRWQKNVRIDNCAFSNMRRHAVQYFGFESYGVIDHCYFTNNFTAIEANGRNGLSWDFSSTPYGIGTTNCVVVEDCYFENNDDSLVTDLNNTIYNSNGSRLSMRNCEARGYGTEQSFVFWDSHGNNSQEPFTDPEISARGTVFVTISNLVLSAESSYRHFYLRGGMHALVNITASGPVGADFISLTEEEAWADFSFPTILTVWPAPDQITNTWITADVTYNGVAVNEAKIISDFGDANADGNPAGYDDNDETFIQLGRDYFLVASVGDIPAFSATGHPTISGGSYGVDWLVYPHPRVTAEDGGGGGGSSGVGDTKVVELRIGTIQVAP